MDTQGKSMPYLKVKQGNKWCIYKEQDGKKTGATLGCHPTEEKANKQIAALNINVKEIMKPKKLDEAVDEIETEVEEMYPSYDVIDRANVPWGAMSFDDVAAARKASELMERLEGHTSVFYTLFWRIWNNDDIPVSEKVPAWESLMADFTSAFDAEISTEESAMAELEDFAESDMGSIVRISESDKQNSDARSPLKMDIVVIQPGWGNPKDNHYYPAEVLRRDAHIFEGAKMYATDHRPEEKNVRTEVAKVERIIGFSEDGAPIGRVKVWNPDFAEDIRNREKLGELETLKCSILAKGKAKKGQIDGKDANIVEAIIASKYTNVDFVTNAGAGGRALRLVENDEEVQMEKDEDLVEVDEIEEKTTEDEIQESDDVILEEQDDEIAEDETEVIEDETGDDEVSEGDEDEPTHLAETDVFEILEKSKLPEQARERIATGNYLSEAELQSAITAEKDYIKALLGSGEPQDLGNTSAAAEKPLTDKEIAEDHQRRIDAIIFSD